MTTPPITSITDELIADLERLTGDSELTDEQWISGFTAGDFRALLAERADLKQQLVAAGITAENCEMFRKDAERFAWWFEQAKAATDGSYLTTLDQWRDTMDRAISGSAT